MNAKLMETEASFLLFDDKSDSYFIARRSANEVKPEYRDMEIGETRMLSETIGIVREK